jgi:hypothetical protein
LEALSFIGESIQPRSVKVIDNDLIYTAGAHGFGYWQKNEFETLEYTSVSQQINVDILKMRSFGI